MHNQVIIAGFHRSGTSLTAQLLHHAGLFLGEEFLGANSSNPHGHFEDTEIVRFHDQLLADNGFNWQVSSPFLPVVTPYYWKKLESMIERRQLEHSLWGFKDPRVCLFLMVWKYLLPNAKVLIIYRHYTDSFYSLARRHSRQLLEDKKGSERIRRVHRAFWEVPDLALRMWLVHNKALLAFARTYPNDTLVISQKMLIQEFPLIKLLNNCWETSLIDVPVAEVFDSSMTTENFYKQPICDQSIVPKLEQTLQELEFLSDQTKTLI